MQFYTHSSQVLVIDVQERLFSHIAEHLILENKLLCLLQGLKVFELPTLVSEQYTKGLGHTMEVLHEQLADAIFGEKTIFSCVADLQLEKQLMANKKNQVIICGIEAHICVQQTALDLVSKGFDVCVVVDAIGSRNSLDKQIAIQRMTQEGVRMATIESILFELCIDAKDPNFKKILAIVK